jgi:hypothetical protein
MLQTDVKCPLLSLLSLNAADGCKVSIVVFVVARLETSLKIPSIKCHENSSYTKTRCPPVCPDYGGKMQYFERLATSWTVRG